MKKIAIFMVVLSFVIVMILALYVYHFYDEMKNSQETALVVNNKKFAIWGFGSCDNR